MKKIVLAPDSFKGTMRAIEVCQHLAQGIEEVYPDCEIIMLPIADGGEGSVEAFLAALGGQKQYCRVAGPWRSEVEAYYGILPHDTVVIEMAQAAGLTLAGARRDPGKTTTYGVGELMKNALDHHPKTMIVALGGSSTNDGGAGAAAALGVAFYDHQGRRFVPVGETLLDIGRIDASQLDPRLSKVTLVTMCDIDNPLCGLRGAAHVFAPQKGASPTDVLHLDAGLAHLAKIIARDLRQEISHLPGAGAAGGMGGGMVGFFSSTLQMGIDVILDTARFEQVILGADLVITGEGMFDCQSLDGKVVAGVSRRAAQMGVATIAIVGDIDDQADQRLLPGLAGVFSINRMALSYPKAQVRAAQDLRATVKSLLGFLQTWEKIRCQ